MTTRVLLAVVLLSSIFSFAQNKDAASSRDSAQPTAPAPKAADSSSQFAYLHVYRARRYMGSALAPTIIVDTTKVARVGSGRRFTAKLAPGTHMVLSDDKSSAITVEAVAGQHYYIRVDEETGFWKGHAS